MRRRAYFFSSSPRQSASKSKVERARDLRRAPTKAEEMVWRLVRRRGVDGWRFHRQHVIAGFIVDFYCAALKLVLEIDGDVHAAQRAEDACRDAALAELGCVVVRLRNETVLDDPAAAARLISQACHRREAAV